MPNIQTFIFVDFEATGLFPDARMNPVTGRPVPGQDRDLALLFRRISEQCSHSVAPHATEVCLLTIDRKSLEECMQSELSKNDDNDDYMISKAIGVHARQFKPNLTESQWNEYSRKRLQLPDIFHLSREELEVKATFAAEWSGIKHLLETVPKPACLIAHNGLKYDFRLLKTELTRAGLTGTEAVPENVFFLDSYLMTIDVENGYFTDLRSQIDNVDWARLIPISRPSKIQQEQQSQNQAADQTFDSTSSSIRDKWQEMDKKRVKEELSPKEDLNQEKSLVQTSVSASHGHNLTPVRSAICSDENREESTNSREMSGQNGAAPTSADNGTGACKRRLDFEDSEISPLHFIRKGSWSPAKRRRVESKRNLFRADSEGNWTFDHCESRRHFCETGSFSLANLYRFHSENNNEPPGAHRAQADCWSLIRVSLAYGRDFLHYADTRAARLHF